jgi:hydroxymethylbilane synthase
MASTNLRIATRQSPLALWQANHVRKQLLNHWPHLHVELLPMTTSGDQFLNDKLLSVGGKGLFVKELEEALLDGRADLAVHSMKDLPITFPKGLQLATICARENPFDAFLSTQFDTLEHLPPGAIVGTSSLRRQAQLLNIRPDLHIKSLRGNVGTRLSKLDAHEYDAIILAASGLYRLNLHTRINEIFDESIMLPACGQGALGIECREGDESLNILLKPLHDPLSAMCIQTERNVNARLGGSCHTPLAVYCRHDSQHQLILKATVASVDGSTLITTTHQGSPEQASALATRCANALLDQGAAQLLNLPIDHG